MIKNLISKWKNRNKITNQKLFDMFGETTNIRNGVGFGFVSSHELYDNNFLEIGIGKVTSGYGDWGMGSSYASESAIKITIDNNYVIQEVKHGSFYNSNEANKEKSKLAKKLKEKFKIGDVFEVDHELLKERLEYIFSISPRNVHIGEDIFGHHSEHDDTSDKVRPSWYKVKKDTEHLKDIGDYVVQDYENYYETKICYMHLSQKLLRDIEDNFKRIYKVYFNQVSYQQFIDNDCVVGLYAPYYDSEEYLNEIIEYVKEHKK